MSKNCPVCDLPPGDPDRSDGTTCGMWWTLQGRRCVPSYEEFLTCYNRARPLRARLNAAFAELADTKTKLAAAQRSLSRHHDKATGRDLKPENMFRDGARIE